MSTIRVDNFGPSAGGTTYSARGIAKAWVNFNGTGTIAARDSENVSSLTDNGTGDYSLAITNAMAASDYSVTATTCIESGESDVRVVSLNLNRAFNTTSFSLKTMYNTSTASDRSQVHANVDGDLA